MCIWYRRVGRWWGLSFLVD